MNKFLIALLFIISPITIFAQSSNVGIIQGIWFSEDTYFSGDTIRMYTAVQNNTGNDVEGKVEFFNNGILLGTKSFTSINSRIAELWIDTLATKGKHQFSVKITELVKNKPGEAKEIITPKIIESEDIIIIDDDTDGDGIGDKEDDDDDGDGYSDKEERKNNSDPLDSESVPKQEKVNDAENTGDTEINKPDFILELEESYPELITLTNPINLLQNILVPKIKKEIERIELQKEDLKLVEEDGINREKREVDSEEEIMNDSSKKINQGIGDVKSFAITTYEIILFGMSWLFSCLICTIILLFIGIYLVLKILFYIMKILLRRKE